MYIYVCMYICMYVYVCKNASLLYKWSENAHSIIINLFFIRFHHFRKKLFDNQVIPLIILLSLLL